MTFSDFGFCMAGFSMGLITMLMVFVVTQPRRPKPRFCDILYTKDDGEAYRCLQVVSPTCVSGLCRKHCATCGCGCIKENGL